MLGVEKHVVLSTVILSVSNFHYSWCVLFSSIILGISEHLRVRLLLGIVRVDAEAAPRSATSAGSDRKEPMSLARCGFLGPFIQWGGTVTPGVGAVVMNSSPVFPGVLEQLAVGFPLGVMGMGAEPVPKVCTRHRFRLEGTSTTSCTGVSASYSCTGVSASLDPGGPICWSWVLG